MKKSKRSLAGVAAANAFSLLHVARLLMRQGTTAGVYGTDSDSLNYLTSNRSTTSDITTWSMVC